MFGITPAKIWTDLNTYVGLWRNSCPPQIILWHLISLHFFIQNLHITGKLRPLYGQRVRGEDGVPVDVEPPGLALFALASPLQQPSIMEIYVRNMIFRTKHHLNFKPLSLDAK